jgi:hypothetical protein
MTAETKSRITAPPSAELLERLHSALSYDPLTGHFTWLVQRGNVRPGDRAGSAAKDGYWRIGFEGDEFYAHHIAWFFMTGAWSTLEIDHENGVPDANWWSNLRQATTSQNHHNRHKVAGTSRFKGVSWSAKHGRWKSEMRGKYFGLFDDEELAARAYGLGAMARDPEFAHTNFPREEYAGLGEPG